MQIERDTLEMLQCHPYPHEYVDTTKQCAHSAFFMGLQRKQGEKVQGQQFDIRGTVDEFKQSIDMYNFWKPGMEIYVSHVRRRQLPSYVFPDGCKRPRPSRVVAQQHDGELSGTGSGEGHLKRKNDFGGGTPEKRQSISPRRQDSISPEIIIDKAGSASPETLDNCFSMEVAESNKRNLSGEKEHGDASNCSGITNVTSMSSCEDTGFGSVAASSEGNRSVEGSSIGSNTASLCEADSESVSVSGGENGNLQQNGSQEGLEVLDLSSSTLTACDSYSLFTCLLLQHLCYSDVFIFHSNSELI